MTMREVVSGATWRPYYDLRATNNDGKPSPDVSLHYCANITQSTGEDWDDASLTLSTANSQTLRSLSVPTVECLKIAASTPVVIAEHRRPRSRSPPYSGHGQYRRRAVLSRSPEWDRQPIRCSPPPNNVATQLPEPAEIDRGNPLSLAFRIGDAASLPSDGLAHKVSIAVLDFAAELQYVCVPRQMEAAFIEASIKNTSEYELLAGPVSVFMNDGFVTKTSLGVRLSLPPYP